MDNEDRQENNSAEEERGESHRDHDDQVITTIGDISVTYDFIDLIRSNGA